MTAQLKLYEPTSTERSLKKEYRFQATTVSVRSSGRKHHETSTFLYFH
jgi:hypothetical protein